MKKTLKYGIVTAAVALSGTTALALAGLSLPVEDEHRYSDYGVENLYGVITSETREKMEERRRRNAERKALEAEHEDDGGIADEQMHTTMLVHPEKKENILATYALEPMSETDAEKIYGTSVSTDYEMLREAARDGSMNEEDAAETYRKAATAYIATANYYMTHELSDTDKLLEADEAILAESSDDPHMPERDVVWKRLGCFGRNRVAVNCRAYVQFLGDETLGLFEEAVDGNEVRVSEALVDALKLTKGHVWRQQVFLVGYDEEELGEDDNDRLTEIAESHLDGIV